MLDLIQSVTVESLRDQMLAAGYRIEVVAGSGAGDSFLRSSTSGLSFDIRMGNRLPDHDESFADFTLVAVFNIAGSLPLEPINAWNGSRRFARLQIETADHNRKFLVLYMDIAVAGGLGPQLLRHQIQIWDGLIQQLLPWLRDELARLRLSDGGGFAASGNAPPATTLTQNPPAARMITT